VAVAIPQPTSIFPSRIEPGLGHDLLLANESVDDDRLRALADCGARVTASLLKARSDVIGDVSQRERVEVLRDRLIEQRPLGIGKQLLHDPGRRAREGVRRGLPLMLDHAADLPVRARNGKHVLNLVEHDQARRAVPVKQRHRELQQPQQHGLGVDARVALQGRGESPTAQRQPDVPAA